MNQVSVIGRITKDPELRFTTSGKGVSNVSIAVDRGFGDSKGVDFFNVVVWNKAAEALVGYCKKGRKIAVSGRLQSRSWKAQDGSTRYATEIVAHSVEFLEAPKGDNNGEEPDMAPVGLAPEDSEEDVPF